MLSRWRCKRSETELSPLAGLMCLTAGGPSSPTGLTSRAKMVLQVFGAYPFISLAQFILDVLFFSCHTALWNSAVTTRMTNPNLTQVTLVDLRPATYYSLRMFAINSQGISDASNVLTVATEEAGKVESYKVAFLVHLGEIFFHLISLLPFHFFAA